MPYFSRLTDIVTCNLSSLLADADDPAAALQEILREMGEGVAGAERSVRTAAQNLARIESEIGEQRQATSDWVERAQSALRSGDESSARQALERKHEVEDLIAGLEQQLQSAIATRDHLRTMLQALQARLADARRRQQEIDGTPERVTTGDAKAAPVAITPSRRGRVDAELEELRRQLGQ